MLFVVSFAWVTAAEGSSAAAQVLMGEPCTSKADIFSLGVVLYEIVTGEILQLLSGRSLFFVQWQGGHWDLTAVEQRGLELFSNEAKTPNKPLCRSCR